MDERLKELGQKYGGNFAGNGVAAAPVSNRPKTFFDSTTNQHYTFDSNGSLKPISPPPAQGQSFVQKLGAVGTQALHIATQGAETAGKFVVNTGVDIGKAAVGVARTARDAVTQPIALYEADKQNSKLDISQQQLQDAYKSGRVSKQEYITQLKNLADARQKINKDLIDPILAGPTPGQRAQQVVETGVNLLTLGRYKPIEAVGAKAVGRSFVLLGKQGAREGLEKTLFTAGTKVEKALQTVPAFRELVAKNTQAFVDQSVKQLAGETTSQFITRNAKNIAVGLLIKRPIVYQTNIGLTQDTYGEILDGHYNQAVKDAAWIGAQAIGGGPLGWFARNTKKFAGRLGKLANGKGSFIDELSKKIGNGTPGQIAEHLLNLKVNDSKAFADTEKAMRIAQEVNLQVTNNNVQNAVEAITSHYVQHGIDLASLTPEKIVDDLHKWAQADEIAQKLSPKDGAQYVAVRWDKSAKNALADRIELAGDNFKAMTDTLSEMATQPGVGWGNNQILMSRIVKAISESSSAAEAAQKIRVISTVASIAKDIPKSQAKKLAELGYSVAEPFGGRKTPTVDYADTRKLVSAVSDGSDMFDPAVAPQPVLDTLGSQLRKYGVSPESNTTTSYDKLSGALVDNLDRLGASGELGVGGDDPVKGGKFILSRLQDYINKQAPNTYLNAGTLGRGQQSALQDIRQMNLKEIMEALPGTSKETAKKLQQAILKSYTDVPMEFRGLGVKATDYAYRVPGAKQYFRIQSALRYVYNPFFRAQEVAETKILSHMKANNLVWMKPRTELDRVGKVLDDSGVLTGGYTGEATQDLTIGREHANLLKTQKRDLAGLALDIAEKKGITVEQMVRDHPEELGDALRVIVQYPSKGILNSPLARTLNLAFFPMRYNLKVAGLVAKEVSKLPPTVQTAFIHSMFKMSDWMKSPEGIQWQSDNADAIQVFSYFTPIQNVESVLNLLHGKPDSVGSLGLLGGLPFGFISQILDAEGVIHLNTPYVDPKTGTVLPDHIPQTTKARAAVALQGLINTMFSYPGRILGLPGKSQFIRNEVNMFLKTGNGDYLKQIRTEDLTPLQQKWISVLGDPKITQSKLDELYTTPAPGQFNWYTLPPLNLPKPVKVLTHTEVTQAKESQRTAPSGKKKALPIPAQGDTLNV
jgi:hypothetical protein